MSEAADVTIDTDKARLDFDVIHGFLSTSYWSPNIPREIVRRAIEQLAVFRRVHRRRAVGFARVITDCATFAYLADVFMLEDYRGRGLSKRLMDAIVESSATAGAAPLDADHARCARALRAIRLHAAGDAGEVHGTSSATVGQCG